MATFILLRHSFRSVDLKRILLPSSQQMVKKSLVEQCRPFSSTVASFSKQEHAGHDHSKHWTAERIVSIGLLGIVPSAVIMPNPVLDCALALTVTAHAHWGLEAIVVDYIRPNIFGEIISKVSVAMLYVLSMFTFGSLCYFNFADVGLGQAVRMLWTL